MKMVTVIDRTGASHTYKHPELALHIVGEYVTVQIKKYALNSAAYDLIELGVYHNPIRVHVEYPDDPKMFDVKIA